MLKSLKVWGLVTVVIVAVWVLGLNSSPDSTRMITPDGRLMRIEQNTPAGVSNAPVSDDGQIVMAHFTDRGLTIHT
ncbi:MAG: hypothetical protein ACFCVE_07295 [Phycisphaerae bacterium]